MSCLSQGCSYWFRHPHSAFSVELLSLFVLDPTLCRRSISGCILSIYVAIRIGPSCSPLSTNALAFHANFSFHPLYALLRAISLFLSHCSISPHATQRHTGRGSGICVDQRRQAPHAAVIVVVARTRPVVLPKAVSCAGYTPPQPCGAQPATGPALGDRRVSLASCSRSVFGA